MIKVLEISGIEEAYLNIIKATQKTDIQIQIKQNLRTISLKSEKDKAVQLEVETRKAEVKILLFADNMIEYISDPQNSNRELLELINTKEDQG